MVHTNDQPTSSLSVDDPGIMRIRVAEPGPYLLEVLTDAERAALLPEDRPAEFFRYRENCNVRFRPE